MKTLIPLLLVILICVIPALSWRRVRVRAHGSISVRARVRVRIGKRSIDWNGKHYTVDLDQCYFDFYDLNNDGMIEKEEMVTIFGENEKAEELFEALDITTGDGLINEEEFNVMADRILDGCQEQEIVGEEIDEGDI